MTRITEHEEQVVFVATVQMYFRNEPTFIPQLFFSVPNGAWLGGKSYAMYNRLKAEGVRPGVADLLYLQPRGQYAYLAIEMKAPDKLGKTGAVSPDQQEFLDAVRRNGGHAVVCFSADGAIHTFNEYMKLPIKKLEE